MLVDWRVGAVRDQGGARDEREAFRSGKRIHTGKAGARDSRYVWSAIESFWIELTFNNKVKIITRKVAGMRALMNWSLQEKAEEHACTSWPRRPRSRLLARMSELILPKSRCTIFVQGQLGNNFQVSTR
jgi:EAL domain-containing protein (putative c-di-GMP-specific phosphodiesterase class I)